MLVDVVCGIAVGEDKEGKQEEDSRGFRGHSWFFGMVYYISI